MAVQLSLALFALQIFAHAQFRSALRVCRAMAIGACAARALRQNGSIWSASHVETGICDRPGSTPLIIDCGSITANLRLKAFSPEQFNRF
jgi:hypothetical protein